MTAAFAEWPDLAVRTLGGGVVAANDELFAAKENLVRTEPPTHLPHTFGSKGQVYDGWETRRRREPGHDWAVVRLGVPGVVRGVVVDTSFFAGNFPPECSVEACRTDGYPSPDELRGWHTLVPRSALRGDARNAFPVHAGGVVTHVRLTIHPDGGVARLRVHGEPVPDPRPFAHLPLDLAAAVNGGRVLAASDRFHGRPENLLLPGNAATMGDGWETARRRDDGNDWVQVTLGGRGEIGVVELDTTHFVGNAPAAAALRGRDGAGPWVGVLPRTRLQPDTPHRFVVVGTPRVTEVRLDVYPDGGLARLRCHGRLTPDAYEALLRRWQR
ncbi:MAG: allantoicase [Streptosporangiales bacterium]|nr:allantoicase [Streptosporangiales bacterium]